MQRDDAYRIVQRLAQQAWDTRRRCATLLERGTGRRPRPRRDLRLRPLHSPRARGACAAGGDRAAHAVTRLPRMLRRSARRAVAGPLPRDPARIIDPFLYVENDGRRVARRQRARRRQAQRRSDRDPRPVRRSARDELLAAGLTRHESTSRSARARVRAARHPSARRASGLPGRRRRPPARRRHRVLVDPGVFVRRRRVKTRRDRGHPPRAAGRGRGDGRRARG